MKRSLLVACIMGSLFSCSRPPKVKDAGELGKQVFELFQQGKSEQIESYIITEEEVAKAFSTNEEFKKLSEQEKKEFVSSTSARIRRDATSLIKFYTDKKQENTVALQKGVFERVSSMQKDENGPSVTRIRVLFSSGGQKYYLHLDASKVEDYWKLLTWIDVKKAVGE